MFDSLASFLGINLGALISAIFSALFALGAIAVGIILSAAVFSKKKENKYTGFMGKLYDLVNFKKFAILPLLRTTYIILAIYISLDAIMCFPRYGFWSGLEKFAMELIIGNAVLRIVYELAMLLVKGVRSLNAIQRDLNDKDTDAPEFMESFSTPKSSTAPLVSGRVPAPTLAPIEPGSASSYNDDEEFAKPWLPTSKFVSVSTPATSPTLSPAPEPVSTPDPGQNAVPGAQPEQSAENVTIFCINCGKGIKAQSRFCPYCGTKQ